MHECFQTSLVEIDPAVIYLKTKPCKKFEYRQTDDGQMSTDDQNSYYVKKYINSNLVDREISTTIKYSF